MFIVLTGSNLEKTRIRFHVHNISHYYMDSGKTFVKAMGVNMPWEVLETPEEIDKLMTESYVTVKDLQRPVSK